MRNKIIKWSGTVLIAWVAFRVLSHYAARDYPEYFLLADKNLYWIIPVLVVVSLISMIRRGAHGGHGGGHGHGYSLDMWKVSKSICLLALTAFGVYVFYGIGYHVAHSPSRVKPPTAEVEPLPELETGTKTVVLSEGQRSEPIEQRADYSTTVDYDAPVLVQRYKRVGRNVALLPSQPELRLPGKSYLNLHDELYCYSPKSGTVTLTITRQKKN